jgi:hypothetical protein
MKKDPVTKELEKIKKSNPKNEAISRLEKFMQEKNYKNYSSALGSFAYKFGISFGNHVMIENEKVLGYIPYIVYYHNNAFNEKDDVKSLVDDNNYFRNIDESKAFCTKSVVYKIMSVNNLEEYY